MGKSDQLRAAGELIRTCRWAALATTDERGEPQASMVAYALEDDFTGILLHLSRLAGHTGNLLSQGRASLIIGRTDDGIGDPQQLARITVTGRVEPLPSQHRDFGAAKARYISRLPQAEPRFGFSDFVLFRLVPERAQWVGGFGKALTLGLPDLERAARLSAE